MHPASSSKPLMFDLPFASPTFLSGSVSAPLFLVLVGLLFLFPAPLVADEGIGELDGFLEAETVPEKEALLPQSTTSPLNIDVQWRLWKRVANEGRSGSTEIVALQNDALSLGVPALPAYQAALLAATRSPSFEFSASQKEEILESAQHLASHLPYPQFEIANLRLREDPLSLHRAIASYFNGIAIGYEWLDTRINWALRGILLLLIALGVSFLGFLLAQLLRYFGIAAYDGTRILPRGFSSTQTVILLVALVLVPGLVLQSPLLSLILLLLLVIPFQQLNERLISLVFLSVLASLPWIDQQAGRFVTYPGSEAQQLLHAHHHGCFQPECLSWLQERAKTDDQVAGYALATHRFRTASHAEMASLESFLAEHAPSTTTLRGPWLNLYGATLIARGKSEQALDVLDDAIAWSPSDPAPYFNQMRALQILGDYDQSYRVLEEALGRNLPLVSRRLQTTRRDPPSFLMISPIPAHVIWVHHQAADQNPSLITPFWTAVAGEKVPVSWGLPLGLVGVVLIFLSLPLYLRRKLSTPCPKCSLARDPTDAEDTNHHQYCLPCYQTFVSAAHLDYNTRIHSESALGRRDRFQGLLRRLLSLILPGTGHILGGHAIRGTLAIMVLTLGLTLLVFPNGLWRLPLALLSEDGGGLMILAWVLISIGATFGLNGLLRGVDPTNSTPPRRLTRGPR